MLLLSVLIIPENSSYPNSRSLPPPWAAAPRRIRISCGAASTREPARQGMWGIFQVFVSTFLVCTMTALAILTAGLDGSVPPPEMAGAAFSTAMGPLGPGFAAAAMLLFAWSSVLGWSQYGAECWCYLFGPDTLWAYRLAFLALILPGCTAGFAAVWALADTFNGLMMLPNLIGLFALSGEVKAETDAYLKRRDKQ